MKIGRELSELILINRMRLLVLIGLLGGLWLVAKFVTKANVLPVTEIRLVGSFKQTLPDQLSQIVAKQINGNLLTLDIDEVYAALIKQPWIAQAWVDRVWPATLQVRIVEQKAIAVWNNRALVNQQGDIFSPARRGSFWDRLPHLIGPQRSAQSVVQTYTKLHQLLSMPDFTIDWVKLDRRRAWLLRLSNGMELVLGRENTLQRFSQFIRIYEDKVLFRKNAIERVDLRYTNGFALRWKEQLSQLIKPTIMV